MKKVIAIVTAVASLANCTSGSPEIICPDFTLVPEAGQILGSDAHAFAPVAGARVVRLENGGLLVAPTFSAGHMALFDASARFETAWGAEGGGPGEYRQVQDLLAVEESIYIADRRNSRVSIVDKSGTFARAFAVSGAINDVIHLGGDSILVYATPTPGSGRGALQVFVGDSEPLFTFPDNAQAARDASASREVAVTDSFIVALRRTRYWVELYTHGGEFIREVRVRAPWFKGFDPARVMQLRGSGASVFEDVVGTPDNIILSLSRRENDDALRFEKAARAEPNVLTQGISLALQDSIFDYFVSAFDLGRGCSVSTLRFAHGVFTGFTDAGELIELTELSSGATAIRLWSLGKSQTSGGRNGE